jgi:hypothetical protein
LGRLGAGSHASAAKQLTDKNVDEIVSKYTNGSLLSPFNAVQYSTISSGDGSCKWPWSGERIQPVPPSFDVKATLESTALKMIGVVFVNLITLQPQEILGDLAEGLVDIVRDDMVQNKCGGRPAIAGQFCNFQTYDVPEHYTDSALAAKRDQLAQKAYGRTCNDQKGSKLVLGSSDICAVVMSMIFCAQAMPACSQEVWMTTCLETCVLAKHCAALQGGNTLNVQECQFEICIFPESTYNWWKVWQFRSTLQIVIFALGCIALCVCCLGVCMVFGG